MTIGYSAYVATSRGIPSCFVKLLRRQEWRGSIYKIMYQDLIIFLGLYYSINLCYRFVMNEEEKRIFHSVVDYFFVYNTLIPLTFVLGFYVNIVVGRWSYQFKNVPWPDPIAVYVSTLIRGQDERGRKMRRTVMRYVNLSLIMIFSLISPKVKKRFPTLDSLVDAGVLVENEKLIIDAIDNLYPKQPKYWMPIVWASSIFTRARKEGRIRDDFALRTLNDGINEIRNQSIVLLHYDTISIPLVYTQVVTLAVYAYFVAALIGQQWTENKATGGYANFIDAYFPFFVTLEFLFFMGWFKVAESLICPFGEDDDDLEINHYIDRNLLVSYLIVDEMHSRHPQLLKDQYWDEIYPTELPGGGNEPPEHSTARLDTKRDGAGSGGSLHEEKDSNVRFLFKRDRENESGSLPMTHFRENVESRLPPAYFRENTESDEDDEEEILADVKRLQPSKGSSITTLHPIPEEPEKEEEEEEEDTFEKLREERERERIERQQQKVQRTVENVAEAAKIRRRSSQLENAEGQSEDDSHKDKTPALQKKPDEKEKDSESKTDEESKDPENKSDQEKKDD